LHILLSSLTYNVIAVCETWLTKKVPDSLIISNFPYIIIRSDRLKKGGGVCLLISHNIAYSEVSTKKIPNSNILAIDIIDSISLKKYRIVSIYRPTTNKPNKDFEFFIESLVELCQIDFSIILLGDFNFPNLCWQINNHIHHNSLSIKETMFLNFICSFDLQQLVFFPTRKEATLDLLFTNKPELVPFVICSTFQ